MGFSPSGASLSFVQCLDLRVRSASRRVGQAWSLFFLPSFRGGRAIKNCQFSSFFHGDTDPLMPWVLTFLQWQSGGVKLGCAHDWQPATAPLKKPPLQRPKWTSHCDGAWIGTTNYLWMAKLLGSFRLYNVNYWILSRSEHAQLGFVAQFALQRLTFHLTLLTFDKSDLVGINSTHLLLALWCFSPLDPKSWRSKQPQEDI